jgi:uncharacterized membrane protein (Fun14 family)
MFNGTFAIIFTIVGISLGIVYNKFVIKDYPDYKRKFGYFITVIVFTAFTLASFGIISINSGVNSTIKVYSTELERYIKGNFPDNEFVKNGLDLKEINNDLSQINNSVNELKTILPTNVELGVNKFIYDLVVDYAIKNLQKRLTVVNYSAKMINSFSDRNNILTVSSIMNGLQTNARKLVNIISLIIIGIFILVLSIYIITTLVIVRREKKYKND